jgi:hypothetical protein
MQKLPPQTGGSFFFVIDKSPKTAILNEDL